MNEDVNGDEQMERFEDLGRNLFQVPKEDIENTEDISEEESEADE